MGSNWKEISFTEAVEINPRVKLKNGEVYPFVEMKTIDPAWRNVTESEKRTFTGGGSKFEPFDTLLARITPCLENGKIARYVASNGACGPAFGSTEFMVIRGKDGITDNNFAYYLTKWQEFRQFAISQMTGSSGRQRVPAESLGGFTVPVPDITEQRAIAHILGSLDDKIELNRRMNETLEAMAQALFKSWFVDFDPVIDNALAAGNPIPEDLQARAALRESLGDTRKPLPEDLRNLFPGEFEFTEEMGWIPKGWKNGKIHQLCSKVQNGGTPKRDKSEYWHPGTIPWLTSGEVRQTVITSTDAFISQTGLEKSSTKWLHPGSTVVALYGATAGQVAFVATELTTNQAVCGLIPKNGCKYFNYLALSRGVNDLANQARGSAQQNISKGIVEETPVILPPELVLGASEALCTPIFDQWISNLFCDSSLSDLRNTLLPKLLSGEIRIPEAEKLMEEVS